MALICNVAVGIDIAIATTRVANYSTTVANVVLHPLMNVNAVAKRKDKM